MGAEMNQYRRIADTEFCEICHLPLWLFATHGIGICEDCQNKLRDQRELEEKPCQRCGRSYTFQFSCGWCSLCVCDGCVYAEHEDDDCQNPDDVRAAHIGALQA